MAMQNGFGKCGEKFEWGLPDNMAIYSPSDEATRLTGIFSWGKTLPWIGVASPAQKEFAKSTSPIRECHIYGVRLAASAAGGPLQTWAGLDLNIIYGGTAVVALAMAALSFAVTPAQDVNKR